jgi:hypothetical protein
VKAGPYDPAISLLFAPWSPAEGTAQVKEFQAWLLTACIGERIL